MGPKTRPPRQNAPLDCCRAAEELVFTGSDDADDLLTPVSVDIEAAGRRVRIVGVGTDQLNTYPQGLRDTLAIPEPTGWVAREWAGSTRGADHFILATHAGLVSDLAMLETLSSTRNLLYALGGHDHLVLRERVAGTPYIHTGPRSHPNGRQVAS